MKTSRGDIEVWLSASFLPHIEKIENFFYKRGLLYFAYDETRLKSVYKFNIDFFNYFTAFMLKRLYKKIIGFIKCLYEIN